MILVLLSAALPATAQVVSDSNQIQGSYEIINTNPEILAVANVSYLRVTATSLNHTPTLNATTVGLYETTLKRRFGLTVEAGPPGDGIEYRVRFNDIRVPNQIYGFPDLFPGPVEVEPAPDQSADLKECLAMARVHTVDENGDPRQVYRINNSGYAENSGGGLNLRGSGNAYNTSLMWLLQPADGSAGEFRVTVWYREVPELGYLTLSATFPEPAIECDQIYDYVIEVPEDNRVPPEVEYGALTGRFDLVGEEIHSARLDTYNSQWQYGPFPFDFEVLNIPAPLTLRAYYPYVLSGRGYDYQYFRTSSRYRASIEVDQTTDIGDTFVMVPGRIQADVHLVGPPDALSSGGVSCLADLYRDIDTDTNQDGIPNSVYLNGGTRAEVNGTTPAAPGAQWDTGGGFVVKAFSGDYDPAFAELLGDVDFALGHLASEDAIWAPGRTLYRFLNTSSPNDPETYMNQTIRQYDRLQDPVLVEAGAVTRQRDIRACFSEVRMHFLSLSGTFYQPYLTGIGLFDGTDFDGDPSDYEINNISLYGTPTGGATAASEGLVKACLPQGQYNFFPRIIAVNPGGGTTNQDLDPVDLDVGCRQVIDIQPGLQISLDEVPRCVAEPNLTLTGSVNGTFDIDSIVAEVDGAETTGCSGDCGSNPSFSIPVALQPCNNNLSVTAVDVQGGSTSAATTSSVDTAPPTLDGSCQDVEISVQPSVPGTAVTFQVPGATDACDGSLPTICDRPSGSFFPVGDTLVSCQAADRCGFTDSCAFTVRVKEEPIMDGNDDCYFDEFDDDVLSGVWAAAPIGDADAPIVDELGGSLLLTGTGSSLYHDPEDHGAFVGRQADTDDFRVEIEVSDVPVDAGGIYRKASLVARAGLEGDAPRVAVSYVPGFPGGASIMFDVRRADGTAQELGSTVTGVDLPVRLAVERRDGVLTAYFSTDGVTWVRPAGALGGSVALDLGAAPWVGAMSTSYDTAQPVTFAFDHFSLCEPSSTVPEITGVCDGSDLDVVLLLDYSASMGRELDDMTKKSDVARDVLSRVASALGETGDHRVAVISVTADAPPFDYPTVTASTLQGLTTDTASAVAALDLLPEPDDEDATPLADGLRRARELLENTASAERHPVVLWVTDGMATVDGSGNGPVFYLEPEVTAVPIELPDGTFRSRGDVAWSGNFNPLIATFDGEATADAMAEAELLAETFPDLRVLTLMPVSTGEPGYRDLPDYAAHITSGEVFALMAANTAESTAQALLTSMACGESGVATVGGRLWHDADGSGTAESGEAGIDGVTVRLLDGATEVASTVTADGGEYLFADVAPGTYTVSVDEAGLPAGLDERTYDADGTASPGQSTLTVGEWAVALDQDFGYRPSGGPLTGCLIDGFDAIGGEWTLASLGNADQAAASAVGGELHLAGDGTTLYAGTDHGAFLYRQVEGDFVAEVDVTGFPVNAGGAYRKGGLMVRTGLGIDDPRILVQYAPSWNNGSQTALQFRYRATQGGPGDGALGSNLFQVPLPARLRIARDGATFRVAFSTDGGTTWVTPTGGSGGSVNLPWGDTVLLGMNVVSYDASTATTASFDDFQACAPGAEP